tara:strand:- start:220 stop:726 length:507 start_codon:yes stop_codon:yes gene_type:complete
MRDDEYFQNDADKRTKEYKDWKALKEAQIIEAESSLKGLGDVVEKITEATGIKAVTKAIFGEDCGCDGRKESLNGLMPFGIKAVECVDESDFVYLKSFFSKTRTRIDRDNQVRLTDIFNHVFAKNMVPPSGCATCSKSGFVKAINALHAYYDAAVSQINNTEDEKEEQ